MKNEIHYLPEEYLDLPVLTTGVDDGERTCWDIALGYVNPNRGVTV